MTTIPTDQLTTKDIPSSEASDTDIIRFAQTLNGYTEVGGEASELGKYIGAFDGGEGAYLRKMDAGMAEALPLNDLRILLFARQRAHYHQGGGWPDGDPVMDEMRVLTDVIRRRVASPLADLSVWVGDITKLDVEAIVNAANNTLAGGGGVDQAIHRGAGPKLLESCLALPEVSSGVRCPTGKARITPGFDLPARYVIHAVGPVWQGGDHNEAELLASAYQSSLDLATTHDLQSVAFPAISTGAYGFPAADAASIAAATVRAFLSEYKKPMRVIFVVFDEEAERAMGRALSAQV